MEAVFFVWILGWISERNHVRISGRTSANISRGIPEDIPGDIQMEFLDIFEGISRVVRKFLKEFQKQSIEYFHKTFFGKFLKHSLIPFFLKNAWNCWRYFWKKFWNPWLVFENLLKNFFYEFCKGYLEQGFSNHRSPPTGGTWADFWWGALAWAISL